MHTHVLRTIRALGIILLFPLSLLNVEDSSEAMWEVPLLAMEQVLLSIALPSLLRTSSMLEIRPSSIMYVGLFFKYHCWLLRVVKPLAPA